MQAVHLGHVHIENGEIERYAGATGLGHLHQRLPGAIGTGHLHEPTFQLILQNFLIGAVVVHHQDAHALQIPDGRKRTDLPPFGQSQLDTEPRPLAHLAFHPDASPHELDQPLADGEPKTGAPELTSGRAVGLGKMIKDLGLRLGGDTYARVFHAKLDLGQGVASLFDGGAHHHLTFRGEFEGVVDQIGEHLPQAKGIATQHQVAHGRLETGRQLQALLRRGLRKHTEYFFDQIAQIEVHLLQFHPSRLDLRKIENVVDDAKQMPARALHPLRKAPLLVAEGAAQQQLGHAQHTIHRRTDFMAHGGEKLALGATGRFRGLLGLDQLGGATHHLLFQMIALRGKAGIALLDLLQHAVKAAGQGIQFANFAGPCPHAEIHTVGHPLHQSVEFSQGLQRGATESIRQAVGSEQCQQRCTQGDQQLHQELQIQGIKADADVERAQGPPVMHDRLREGDVVGRVVDVDLRYPCAGRQHRLATAVHRKAAQLAAVNGGSLHLRRMTQGRQHLARGLKIFKFEAGAGVISQHPCLALIGTDQQEQARHEAADDNDQGNNGQGRDEGNAIDTRQAGSQ